MRSLLVLAVLLTAVPLPAAAQDFSGHVIRVLDGDTIDVRNDAGITRFRLADIDAPEKNQPYGLQSKAMLTTLLGAGAGDIMVKDRGQDTRWHRLIGTVYTPSGNVNEAMVRYGGAWAYTRYDHDNVLPELESQARSSHIGLWALPHVQPWQWRRHEGGFSR